jgi:hypothetical protein
VYTILVFGALRFARSMRLHSLCIYVVTLATEWQLILLCLITGYRDLFQHNVEM